VLSAWIWPPLNVSLSLPILAVHASSLSIIKNNRIHRYPSKVKDFDTFHLYFINGSISPGWESTSLEGIVSDSVKDGDR
jgi:hypothetical protein